MKDKVLKAIELGAKESQLLKRVSNWFLYMKLKKQERDKAKDTHDKLIEAWFSGNKELCLQIIKNIMES